MAAILRRFSVLLCAICLVCFPAAALSQQPPPSASAALQLNLKGAVQLALKQNPQRIISQILTAESDRNAQIARSALLPQAGIAADGGIHQYNFASVERVSQRSAAGPYQVIEAGPTFSQTLLNLPLIRNYQINQEGRREARADEQTTREIVVTAVVDQYLLVLRALATRDAAVSAPRSF